MDKKVAITMWTSNWRKLLACINSKDTRIDKYGDWSYEYETNDKGGTLYKNGRPVFALNKDGEKIVERVDYPGIKFDAITKYLKRELEKGN